MYSDISIRKYLDELASRKPIPGGGSAAALAGALGAALLSKVANFTIGKEKYKEHEAEMKSILESSEALRKSFHNLCSEDSKAYKKFSDAFKLPKDAELRQKKIQDALKEAAAVPLEVCKNSQRALKLCAPLAEKGNISLISDVDVARDMLKAAFHSALLNVEINLKSIKDDKFVLEVRETLKEAG